MASVHMQQYYLTHLHPALGWILTNAVCAVLALLVREAIQITIGKMGVQESAFLRDRICNFVLYKAVFLFGVLNNIDRGDIISWILWSALLAAVTALQSIIEYRLKYLIPSLSSKTVLFRVLILAAFLLTISTAFIYCAYVAFHLFSTSIALFILADAVKLLLRSIYTVSMCVLLLENVSNCFSSINLSTLTYYLEFFHDLAIDSIDLLHYTHMLLYSQVVLSMACIVISIQLRSFYKSFVTRIKRHIKYMRICNHIDRHYQKATLSELNTLQDWCAVCWEQMDTARKLPCNHFFHEGCLRGWLEQDNSCPTCRSSLPSSGAMVTREDEILVVPVLRPFSHVFHFRGPHYARWLPSFSVELSHNFGSDSSQRNRLLNTSNSQLNALAEQISEMFPQLEMEAIMGDLQASGSLQATVENILDGRLRMNDATLDAEDESSSSSDTSSSGDSSTESLDDCDGTSESSHFQSATHSEDGHNNIISQKKALLIQRHRE
ncbi:unnamed protein product [Thelazia callipaeda]|uniref:CUE domain-containing protein n=1 Tax=Thelazia callipaeda TaxID=103827 RepID=A0A0N5CPV3_THECL|nr:unnamed protein product [Thelazia callipaeda]